MTYRYLIYDIAEIMKQQYANRKVNLNQILYWILIYANRLKSKQINDNKTSQYLHIFPNVSIIKATTSSKDIVSGQKYFELPSKVFDLKNDGGISYISYPSYIDTCNPTYTSLTFSRTTRAKAKWLYLNDDEKPSSSNPYFIPIGQKVYLLGLECIDIADLEVGLYTQISIDDINNCDLDEEIDIAPEIISLVQRYVLDIGRFSLSMPKDILNDGTASTDDNMPQNKIVSVNTPAQTNTQE